MQQKLFWVRYYGNYKKKVLAEPTVSHTKNYISQSELSFINEYIIRNIISIVKHLFNYML